MAVRLRHISTVRGHPTANNKQKPEQNNQFHLIKDIQVYLLFVEDEPICLELELQTKIYTIVAKTVRIENMK